MPASLLRLADAIARALSLVASVAAWLLLVMVAVIMFDVTARKIPAFQGLIIDSWLVGYVSSIKLQEWEWHLHTIVFALCLGATYVADGHVRVDLWREKRSERTQAWIEVIGILFMLIPYVGILLYYAVDFVATSFLQGEGSTAVMGLGHRWLIKAVLALGLLMLLLAGVAVLLRRIAFLAGPGPSREAAPCGLPGPSGERD